MKIKGPKTTIVLYVLSILLIVLASIQLFESITYIMNLLDAGSITWGTDLNTMISYISQSCVSYYCFAIVLYVLAKIYQKICKMQPVETVIEEVITTEE